MIFLLVAAAVVVGAPIVAAVLVTVASRREESARSLTGRPPGPITAAARRLLTGPAGPPGRTRVPRRQRTSPATLTRRARAGRGADEGDFMSHVYPYLPGPRASADDDTAEPAVMLPRS